MGFVKSGKRAAATWSLGPARNAMASTDLPRMQHQPRPRAPVERGRKIGSEAAEMAAPKAKPQMMRQYELVERVRKYNPNTDEELLNRAYVYATKAHGAQL